MKRNPIDLFNEWAKAGKDERMAETHEPSVVKMLNYIYKIYDRNYTFIDAGCGNGWVVKKISSQKNCIEAIGVDGSKRMIQKARLKDPKNNYYCDELMSWKPEKKVDIVHSMEVIYYFQNPQKLIKHIVDNWIKVGGLIIAGIDCYIGNPKSYSWGKEMNVHMSIMSDSEWKNIFSNAGLKNCETWRTGDNTNYPKTLVITGKYLP